jgi:hypothetical protein
MNVVLIEEAAGMRTLQSLERCGVRVVAVMASPRRQDGGVGGGASRSFDLHPGPLPRYAGLNSVSWAIYRGEKEHGVTLHKLAPEIDAGPIIFQESVSIGRKETGLSLTAKCVNAGTVGMERSGGVEVACADEWILVRQVFREGICIPPREALKAGDQLADA